MIHTPSIWKFGPHQELMCAAALSALVVIAFDRRRGRRLRTMFHDHGFPPARPSLQQYMAPAMRRLVHWFTTAYWAWCVFYVVMILRECLALLGSTRGVQGADFACNVLSNVTTVALLGFYRELSSPRREEHREGESILASPSAWVTVLSAITVYEAASRFIVPGQATGTGHQFLFQVVYGIAQAVALYLVTGRLESRAIRYYLLAHPSHEAEPLPLVHRLGVFMGYLYASIQPLYVLFDERHITETLVLVLAALALKLWWMLWIWSLFTRPGQVGRVCALAAHAYEMQRFAAEDFSSFERSFLRRHFTPQFVERTRERNLGYLGVEYMHLNDFKRAWLGLAGVSDGLLLRSIHARSDAMAKGLRSGDVVLAVNGMPIGPTSSLSVVMKGCKTGEEVEIEYLRQRFRAEDAALRQGEWLRRTCRVELGEYSELLAARWIPRARARLGWEYLWLSDQHGVVCKRPGQGGAFRITAIVSHELGRRFEVPDLRMLRVALDQMLPGEEVTLCGYTEPDGTGPERIRCALRMLGPSSERPVDGRQPLHPRLAVQIRTAQASDTRRKLEVLVSRVVGLYPDRFHKRFRRSEGAPSDVLRGSTRILCFDEEGRRVVEFVYRAQPAPAATGADAVAQALLGLDIWDALESQALLVLVAAATDITSDDFGWRLFRSGHFFEFELEVLESDR